MHEVVAAPLLLENLLPRSQEQMVGVTEHNIAVNKRCQRVRKQSFHRTFSAHWHKNWGSDLAVGKGDGAGSASANLLVYHKIQSTFHLVYFLSLLR